MCEQYNSQIYNYVINFEFNFATFNLQKMASSPSTETQLSLFDRDCKVKYFPSKLYIMLEHLNKDESSKIVSWTSHGRTFSIIDSIAFVKTILPKYVYNLSIFFN